MDPNEVSYSLYSNAMPYPMGHYTMVLVHKPSGARVQADWSDGEDNEMHMHEQLLEKLEDLVADRLAG